MDPRLKDLRRQRRKQRKTLEALMGIRQEQREREKRAVLSEVSRRATPPSLKQSTLLIQTHNKKPERGTRNPPDVAVTTPEFIKEALRDAVQDFEQCLQRSKDDRLLSSTPKGGAKVQRFDLIEDAPRATSKFNTFPRSLSSPEDHGGVKPQTSTYKMFRQSSNSSLSSISSSSDAVLAGLPSEVPRRYNLDETSSIASITSEMSAQTLRNIREQGRMGSSVEFDV